MKLFNRTILLIFLFLVFFGSPVALNSPDDWGFYAHKKINYLAIFTLPEPLFGFYKENSYFLKEHAVDPDKRRYSVIGEAQKHFIDIDHYCNHADSCNPFGLMPRKWNDALEKFGDDTLQAYGILPWNINTMYYKLKKAFENKDKKRILRLSTELGHYIGDAHVPLHTTENYNGQMTNQVGIHGFWESRLPELFDGSYDFFVGDADYIESPLNKIWNVVETSHNALDSVLLFESQLNDEFREDQKYAYEERGVTLMRVYSEEYSLAYHNMLDGQVERRMREAIHTLGSFWYTAWVDAGQPNLIESDSLNLEELELEVEQEINTEEKEELKQRIHSN